MTTAIIRQANSILGPIGPWSQPLLLRPPLFHSAQGLPRAYRAFPGRSLGLFSALPGPSFEIRVNLIVSSFFVCLCESCLFFAFLFAWSLVLYFFSE